MGYVTPEVDLDPPLGGVKKAVARYALLPPPGLPARRLLAAPWQGVAPPDPRRAMPSQRRRAGTLPCCLA